MRSPQNPKNYRPNNWLFLTLWPLFFFLPLTILRVMATPVPASQSNPIQLSSRWRYDYGYFSSALKSESYIKWRHIRELREGLGREGLAKKVKISHVEASWRVSSSRSLCHKGLYYNQPLSSQMECILIMQSLSRVLISKLEGMWLVKGSLSRDTIPGIDSEGGRCYYHFNHL